MSVMCTKKKQHDRYAQKKLFGWCVLSAIVDLLPHVEVIEGTAIEIEWHASHVVEHNV